MKKKNEKLKSKLKVESWKLKSKKKIEFEDVEKMTEVKSEVRTAEHIPPSLDNVVYRIMLKL